MGGISFHPLVHDWARERQSPGQRHAMAAKAFRVVATMCGQIDMTIASDWAVSRQIFPHVQIVGRWARVLLFKDPPQNDLQLAWDCNQLGFMYHLRCQGKEALEWYQPAFSIRERMLGETNDNTLEMVYRIGDAYGMMSQYSHAGVWYQRGASIYESLYGRDHEKTLHMLYSLGWAYHAEGYEERALELLEDTFARQKALLGPKHPHTLITFQQVGLVYLSLERYDEALKRFKLGLTENEQRFGKEHPATYNKMSHIGQAYYELEKYQEALEWQSRALAGQEKLLEEDRYTLTTVHRIALIYRSMKKYDDALRWYCRALIGRQNLLGKGHIETLKYRSCYSRHLLSPRAICRSSGKSSGRALRSYTDVGRDSSAESTNHAMHRKGV